MVGCSTMTDRIESLQLPNPGCVLLLLFVTHVTQLVHSALVLVSQFLQPLHALQEGLQQDLPRGREGGESEVGGWGGCREGGVGVGRGRSGCREGEE